MLSNLHVKNLALIEEENIDFEEGLNILSGETGAGKSIILGSINAALGAKTSPDFIRTGAEYGLSELLFNIEDDNVIERIKELGVIDIENGELLISRKITPTRSQIKVNGQNFTAAQTQKLARYLIDVHGQHDNQILMDDANHLTVVDTFCADEIAELREAMEDAYKDMVKAKKALELIDKDKDELQKEIAFLEYEANEIQTADIQPDEDEELEARYHKLNNYQKITNELSYADMLLNSGNDNISDMIGTALKSLITASEYDDVLKECCDTLSDAEGLIRDAGHSISSYIENSEYDPREFSELQERLDLINNLKNKYGSSIEAINDTLKAVNAKLADYYNFDELISRRKKEYEEACCKAWDIAQKLSSIRQQAAVKLAEQFIASLKNLNFLDVKFRIDFAKEPSLSSKGCDNVRFMISTNPGENLKPLSKIASGGELSRIMLAIKTVMSEDADKTLIFDEIDAGISGKTASKVSNQLARLSLSHQIICITHLPQIAAMADAHYIIEKSVHDNKTYSNIQRVAGDDSLNEIARMLSGETLTDSVLENAKELKIMAAQLMFTEKQANAILEMRLYKLIGLELEALINEHEETMANIYRYEDILDRRDSMAQVIMNELDGFKKEYSHPRKTVIENGQEAVYKEKELEEMDVVFLMDRFGYAKTIDLSTYERNKEAADAENKYVFTCKNTGRICLFTNTGQMHTVKVLDLPYGKFRDKGVPIDNVSNFSQAKEELVYITSQKELNLCQVIFATAESMLKVVDGGEFDVTKRTVAATKLAEGDTLVSVTALTDQRNIVLQTKGGFFLRFAVDEIPEKKKGAIGVRGMKLSDGDLVENVYYTKNAVETTIEYKGKELVLNNLKLGKRDSKGTKVRV